MNSPLLIAKELQPYSCRLRIRQIFRSHWTFAALQLLDLVTTLAAFHAGGLEVNPLVAHFTLQFGRLGGVLASKVIAVLIATGVRRLLWVVNIFYAGIVSWNVIVLFLLSFKTH